MPKVRHGEQNAPDNDPLSSGGRRFVSVMLGVNLGRFVCMVCGVMVVPLSCVRVVCSGLVIASFVVPGCLTMVAGSVLVMLSSLVVMLCSLFRHISPLPSGCPFERAEPACGKVAGRC
jgi:hypothetical protein